MYGQELSGIFKERYGLDSIKKIKAKVLIADKKAFDEWKGRGFNVNYQFSGGKTLLHMAADYLNVPAFKTLVREGKGAGLDVRDNSRKLPLDYAKRYAIKIVLSSLGLILCTIAIPAVYIFALSKIATKEITRSDNALFFLGFIFTLVLTALFLVFTIKEIRDDVRDYKASKSIVEEAKLKKDQEENPAADMKENSPLNDAKEEPNTGLEKADLEKIDKSLENEGNNATQTEFSHA
ncbi:ankyrin repeat domain-containing protein [Wolbachia endosymbiont of Ctenocephalides felis wCfeT]|uniref:ankyrin repeat domain-containing protein n=1 Tax=Wolbachia endosymbiont of Ctenocephalides felis wCfeT TaxID=2732593 RepID=UPI001446DC31|nr:ankyrin repeat domain-containing protein [Wolbachia endosymbiont of Ctenocephalides felis wCfeT]